MFINSESQVRLSVELRGRIGAPASNASTKKQIRKAAKVTKYTTLKPQKCHFRSETACTQSLLVCSESVQHFISEESRVARCAPSDWKKKKPVERLEAHLQILADSIAQKTGTKYTYQVIN